MAGDIPNLGRSVPILGQQSIPMGVNLTGLETATGIALESRRERFVMVALHALISRESSAAIGSTPLARVAVRFADAALAAMAGQPLETATTPAADPVGEAGS